jgi:histidinol-phosphate aminotransferase
MSISRRTLLARLGTGAALAWPGLGGTSAAGQVQQPAAVTTRSAGPIRLHRNENTLGPSPKAIAAMRNLSEQACIRYPDLEAAALRRKLGAVHGVAVDRIVLGAGSSDILRMAVNAFAGPSKSIVAAVPTYEALAGFAARAGAAVAGVRLRADHSHDVEAMLARVDATTGLVYVCNPNNPTGSLTPRSDLDTLLRRLPAQVVVFVDEAYHDYVGEAADYASFIDRPLAGPRLIVARSFSKVHALAGLRVGYGVTTVDIARSLAVHQSADPVNTLAARAASAALGDLQHVRASVDRTADDRQEFLNQANARMLRSIDSLTNFVMLNAARPGADVVAHFAAHGILIGGPVPGFANYVRVSLGVEAEMREFWRVWDLMPGGHRHG